MLTPSIRNKSGLCRQLGLIFPLPLKAQDRQPNLEISKLRGCLGIIANAYRNDDHETIPRNSREIGKLANGYIEPCGGKIWHRNGAERAGVSPAEDRRANGMYPKDLCWGEPGDQK